MDVMQQVTVLLYSIFLTVQHAVMAVKIPAMCERELSVGVLTVFTSADWECLRSSLSFLRDPHTLNWPADSKD